jgi:hypothetical protein
MRKAYIARYDGDDSETILARDTYWSAELSAKWDELAATTKDRLQAWYADDSQVTLMASRMNPGR